MENLSPMKNAAPKAQDTDTKPYQPTPADAKALEAYRAGQAKKGPRLKVTANSIKIDHADPVFGHLVLVIESAVMFLRRIERRKNGKTHLYWNIVENKRLDGGRVVQRHALYLGEINSSQAEAWRKAVEVFAPDAGRCQTLALFAEDR
jgi:hypothetical protein